MIAGRARRSSAGSASGSMGRRALRAHPFGQRRSVSRRAGEAQRLPCRSDPAGHRTDARTSTTGGTFDARFIRAHCPVVEFGLVGLTMHKVDERVELSELTDLRLSIRLSSTCSLTIPHDCPVRSTDGEFTLSAPAGSGRGKGGRRAGGRLRPPRPIPEPSSGRAPRGPLRVGPLPLAPEGRRGASLLVTI